MTPTITNTPTAHGVIAAMLPAILAQRPFEAASAWDRAMADYLRAEALMRADDAFGMNARHNETRDLLHIRLEAKFGPRWRSNPEARRIIDATGPKWDDDAYCEVFFKPLWAAQRALVQVPAPNIAAALFKLHLIEEAEVWNDNQLKADCMEIIQADFARLADPHPDAPIIDAWERRKEAHDRYNALPGDEVDPDPVVAAAHRDQWAIIDECEEVIRSTVATTTKGAAIQLWAAVAHQVTSRADDQAVTRGDLADLTTRETDHDWTVRLALSALRSLEGMGS